VIVLNNSCVVRSVHSWIKADSFTFESGLVGGWVGIGERADVAMTFVREDDARGGGEAYIVQYSSKDGQGTFLSRIGKFGGDLFLDLTPKEGGPGIDGFLLYPMHSLAKLELRGDDLSVRTLDYGQMKAAAKLGRLSGLKYSWDLEDELVITSDTDELHSFIHTLERDSVLLAPPIRLARRK